MKKILAATAAIVLSLSGYASAVDFTASLSGGGNQGGNDRVGLNLNFLKDKNIPSSPLSTTKVRTLRYPMGEIADYYLWNKNNPAKPKASIYNDSSIWFGSFIDNNGFWKNPLTFDQFMSLCQQVNAKPVVVIGIDAIRYNGSAPHSSKAQIKEAAVEWVKYAKQQGYNVKDWEIGNECDLNNSIIGTWPAQSYANIVKEFSQAMKAEDSSIRIGANGMTGEGWWDIVAPAVKGHINEMVTHQYSFMGNYNQWTNDNNTYDFNYRTMSTIRSRYGMPWNFLVTEASSFNPGQGHWNNTWKSLHNFEVFGNQMKHHANRGTHFWVSRWFDSNPSSNDANAFNANYGLMGMGRSLQAWKFIQQKVKGPEKSGKVRMWLTYKSDRKKACVYLLNKAETSTSATVTVQNYAGPWNYERWELKGSSPGATGVSWSKTGSISRTNNVFTTTLKPLSVTAVYFR